MAGTSQDGIDLAGVLFYKDKAGKEWCWELVHAVTVPYSQEWSLRLKESISLPGAEVAKLHTDYGHLLGFVLRQFIIESGFVPDFVASHGATIFHQPERHFTFQLGCGETIVSYLEVPLICNFRARDVAFGGQGAPLVPAGERALFKEYSVFLNLGGIASIGVHHPTQFDIITWKGKIGEVLGWDISPCNLVLNYLAQKTGVLFDRDGELARSGKINSELLQALKDAPYYALFPPKTLGREWVEENVFPIVDRFNVRDGLHTFVVHLAQVIQNELEKFNIQNTKILVTGGGAFNIFLVEQLRAALAKLNIEVILPSKEIIAYKEAIIFAYLGLACLLRISNVWASVTGAKQNSIAGSIHLPNNSKISLLL